MHRIYSSLKEFVFFKFVSYGDSDGECDGSGYGDGDTSCYITTADNKGDGRYCGDGRGNGSGKGDGNKLGCGYMGTDFLLTESANA